MLGKRRAAPSRSKFRWNELVWNRNSYACNRLELRRKPEPWKKSRDGTQNAVQQTLPAPLLAVRDPSRAPPTTPLRSTLREGDRISREHLSEEVLVFTRAHPSPNRAVPAELPPQRAMPNNPNNHNSLAQALAHTRHSSSSAHNSIRSNTPERNLLAEPRQLRILNHNRRSNNNNRNLSNSLELHSPTPSNDGRRSPRSGRASQVTGFDASSSTPAPSSQTPFLSSSLVR